MNIIKLINTIVDPVGVDKTNDKTNPNINDVVPMITLDMTTLLNVLKYCIAESGGKISKLDINKAPIKRIPKTTTIEHKTANNILYRLVFIPIDFANFSSNVIANIWLYENIKINRIIIDNIILIITSFPPIDKILPNK